MPRPTALRALRASSLACLALGLALLSAAPARAQADAAPADAVLQLLQDKGLLPRIDTLQASPVVRQMRDAASELVISAMNFLGVRYKRGGNRADEGFDCSGFTRYVFEHSIGLVLPRRADQQATWAGLLDIGRNELRPGDLVFFNTLRRTFSHVGIYIGEGRFIHAPRAGAQVRIEDMRERYWDRRYNGARRAAAAGADAAAPLAPPAPSAPALRAAAAPRPAPGPGGEPAELP